MTPGPNGLAADIQTTAANILAFPSRENLPYQPKGATTVKIICESTSPSEVGVNIPEMHGTSEAIINPGESESFRLGYSEMLECNVRGIGAVAAIRWHTVSVTDRPT